MPESYGNLIQTPGFKQIAEVKPDEILASTARFTQKGVTVKSGQGTIAAGRLLARQTSTKKYVLYANAGADGAGTAKGFLRQAVDTTNGDVLANIVLSGILKLTKLSGMDAAGGASDVQLNARRDVDRDWFIF